MIPKIIHYSWISPEPKPERFDIYREGWKRLMPDYEIRQISLENIGRSPFVNKALELKKYVLTVHYSFCEKLYSEGGIYFDIDVEAEKSFDDLLNEKAFMGAENWNRINGAVSGSEKGNPFFKDCMDFLDNYDFNNNGPCGIEIMTGPEMYTTIAERYGWERKDETQRLNGITIFNSNYFYREHHPESYTNHHNAGTWANR
jgi:mannosyltransferase OCH1-like enzyme